MGVPHMEVTHKWKSTPKCSFVQIDSCVYFEAENPSKNIPKWFFQTPGEINMEKVYIERHNVRLYSTVDFRLFLFQSRLINIMSNILVLNEQQKFRSRICTMVCWFYTMIAKLLSSKCSKCSKLQGLRVNTRAILYEDSLELQVSTSVLHLLS